MKLYWHILIDELVTQRTSLLQVNDTLRQLIDSGVRDSFIIGYLNGLRADADEQTEEWILEILDVITGWCSEKYRLRNDARKYGDMLIADAALLNKTYFTNYEDGEIYPTTDYRCKCGRKVSINLHHLMKHWSSSFTNLSIDDTVAIEHTLRASCAEVANSFLDFYCPNCKNPVRIYYDGAAGGRHGEASFLLKYVISRD